MAGFGHEITLCGHGSAARSEVDAKILFDFRQIPLLRRKYVEEKRMVLSTAWVLVGDDLIIGSFTLIYVSHDSFKVGFLKIAFSPIDSRFKN